MKNADDEQQQQPQPQPPSAGDIQKVEAVPWSATATATTMNRTSASSPTIDVLSEVRLLEFVWRFCKGSSTY
ncbi:hypothetical protein Y032_0178g676 [Ancylostoma ceylanicum]|uniref:Uncharacterized protein n=1 Tax=Ancylostoma ceylanicum TaxID=53326 RepID=A0A016STJ0_9BILA|nr:hypothetical protein Y032_0178g676 [Ancylostoma ceylanicum]